MTTYYLIKAKSGALMVAAGKYLRYTYNSNRAKHFTSDVMARAFLAKMPDRDKYDIYTFSRF